MSDSNKTARDGMLVAAVLDGQHGQFEQIVARYHSALWRLALSRLGSPDAADDAVQETFLCTFKSLHTYDSRYSFRTWLWTILLNQCRRAVGRAARLPCRNWTDQTETDGAAADLQASIPDRQAGPPHQLLNKERTELLERMLGQLKEVQADALRLRFFGDLKFQEIADVMGCSLGTAKNRVRAGLTNLTELLQSHDVHASPVDPGGENQGVTR